MEVSDREALLGVMRERALRVGDFVLASGRHSGYYFDGRLVTLDPHGALLIGREMLAWARQDGLARVGGPSVGADPMVASIALCSALDGGPPVAAFIVRKEAKEHGLGGVFVGPEPQPGEAVAMVDDVLTTGGSLLAAAAQVAAAGAEIRAVYTLLDREEGGRERLQREGLQLRSIFTGSDLLQDGRAVAPRTV